MFYNDEESRRQEALRQEEVRQQSLREGQYQRDAEAARLRDEARREAQKQPGW